MPPKTQYNTKQYAQLLDFLQSVKGAHVTVSGICEHFKGLGVNIGTATVYRHLERMLNDGLIEKYIIDAASSACYEYVGDKDDCCESSCFHCKCKQCGKLIHMECDELACIKEHLLEHHGFVLDPYRTVFYGICDDCRKNYSTD